MLLSGEGGAQRVAKYSVPIACGLAYNYAAKAVDDEILDLLAELAEEAQLTEKYAALQELVKHLSSKDVQNESFIQCSNVPAYVGASDFIASAFQSGKITEGQFNLASAQVSMAEWGIPQPFITGTLNSYYYTKQAPDVYKAIIDKTAYPTTGTQLITEEEMQGIEGIRKALYLMEYIWMHGQNAKEFPASLPAKA